MIQNNDYITIVKTHEFYNNEKQHHLDAIAEIDELLKDLPPIPPAYQCYDVGGPGLSPYDILDDDE
jgi:hypothetical protein